MFFKSALASSLVFVASASAGFDHSDTFTDSQNDLFDNGLSNLDITQVTISQLVDGGSVYIDFAITTRGMADWTKYMVFINHDNQGAESNPWNRPIGLNGQASSAFIGSWINGEGGNQLWSLLGDQWMNIMTLPQSVNWISNTVHLGFRVSGEMAGKTLNFDAVTSGGGGNDPGVDHLSRSDMATSGWGSGSVAGQFKSFTVIPAPGALALLGLAGLARSRRSR